MLENYSQSRLNRSEYLKQWPRSPGDWTEGLWACIRRKGLRPGTPLQQFCFRMFCIRGYSIKEFTWIKSSTVKKKKKKSVNYRASFKSNKEINQFTYGRQTCMNWPAPWGQKQVMEKETAVQFLCRQPAMCTRSLLLRPGEGLQHLGSEITLTWQDNVAWLQFQTKI